VIKGRDSTGRRAYALVPRAWLHACRDVSWEL